MRMTDTTAPWRQRWVGRAAFVVVPSVVTGGALVVLSRLGFVGDLPLWLLLSLLIVVSVVGQLTGGVMGRDATAPALRAAIGAQVLAISTLIYAIGWGPTLSVGYVFVVASALDGAGARGWRITLGWAAVGITLGEVAIAVGVVPTYVPAPYVHGLAALDILGMAFVMWLLGAKTEQSERASDARDRAGRDTRTTLSLLRATLDSPADGILVV